MKLNRLHQDIIGRIYSDAQWSHLRIEGWVRKARGYNARSLHLLARAGLLESQVFQGPRGGRIVGLRLTDAGQAVAARIAAIIEGYAPTDELGNFIRTVGTGSTTFTVEN